MALLPASLLTRTSQGGDTSGSSEIPSPKLGSTSLECTQFTKVHLASSEDGSLPSILNKEILGQFRETRRRQQVLKSDFLHRREPKDGILVGRRK